MKCFRYLLIVEADAVAFCNRCVFEIEAYAFLIGKISHFYLDSGTSVPFEFDILRCQWNRGTVVLLPVDGNLYIFGIGVVVIYIISLVSG